MKKVELKYVEPISYFPKSIRKKYKLGEYAEKIRIYTKSYNCKNKKEDVSYACL